MIKIRKFGRLRGGRDQSAVDNQHADASTDLSVVVAAEHAFQSQQWPEVVELLTPWLSRSEATPQMFVWTSIALREQGDLDRAETTIVAGKARFPDASTIGVEWADIAMKRRDWAAAVSRLEPFTGTNEQLPPVAYVKLAIAKTDMGDFEGADQAIAEGWAVHGRIRRLDIESAQVAMKAKNWAEAIERLKWVVANHKDVPPIIYVKLAVANKSVGRYAAANAAIRQGWEKHGRNEKLDTESAQVAMAAGKWTQAVERFEWILGHYENVDVTIYVKLAICRAKANNPVGADRAIYSGWSALGHHIELDLEWASIAKKSMDNAETIRRYQEVIGRHGSECGEVAYLRLASSLIEENEHQMASEILHQACKVFPKDGRALVELANIAMRDGDNGVAADHLEIALARDPAMDAKIYGRLALIYRGNGQAEMAKDVCRRGLGQWPEDLGLLSRWAQEAMVVGDWPEALQRWQNAVDQHDSNRAESYENQELIPVMVLPDKAPDLEWHHGHWHRLVDNWEFAASNLQRRISASLYVAVADVLSRMGSTGRALAMLKEAVAAYPRHPRIQYRLSLQILEDSKPAGGHPADDQVLFGLNTVIGSDALRGEIEAMRVSLDAMAPLERKRPKMRYRQFNACRETSLELMVKAGRFFSHQVVVERIRELSESDLWPEIPGGSLPLEQDARDLAHEFRVRFENETDLEGPALADAVFRLIYSELCVLEPVRRLAASIAEEAGSDRVFVEISGTAMEYMSTYTATGIGQFYLYQELYRLGVNVFFCRFLNQHADPFDWHGLKPLELKPSRVLLRSRGTTKEIDTENTDVAVVPGGIRSVQSVVNRLANPLVYATGYIIQGFAYDRTVFEPLDLSSSFLPSRSLLPAFKYGYDTMAWLVSSDLVGTQESSQTPLGVTASLEGDWIDWLGEALLPSFNEMYRLSLEEVDRRQVKQAHVADNLYAESAIFSAAVKLRGGSVTLWPHSANPVDVDSRHPGSFDRVNAITEVGCQAWRARFPEVDVVHEPTLMLDPPTMQQIDPNQPLSVVVLGGKNVLGLMPFVHQAQHEAAYDELFRGLEKLRTDHNIRTFFKPKGLNGENEAWLDQVVDRSTNWEPVFEHPLRLQLPNMLFISLSVASSAILEGLGRGIPGAVVTDALARDYTTIGGPSIPTGSCSKILDLVRASSLPGGLADLVAEQWSYYSAQTGFSTPVIDLEIEADRAQVEEGAAEPLAAVHTPVPRF